MSMVETALSIKTFGAPVIRKRARPVQNLNERYRTVISSMAGLMYDAGGIGLAAPQVGILRAIIIADIGSGLYKLVNPRIVKRSGSQVNQEGCLSVPGFNATVVRPSRVVLKGLDRAGEEQTIEGTDLLARAFQHEMDHLDGRVFVDRLRGIQRDLIVRRIRKLTRAGKW